MIGCIVYKNGIASNSVRWLNNKYLMEQSRKQFEIVFDISCLGWFYCVCVFVAMPFVISLFQEQTTSYRPLNERFVAGDVGISVVCQ